MNKIILTLILFFCSLIFLHSQVRDSLIELYNGSGNTIDLFDRECFELFPDVKGFKDATLLFGDDQYIVSTINYEIEGKSKVISYVQRKKEFFEIVNKKIQENNERFNSPIDITLFTSSGNEYKGKLEMFSRKFLFLRYNNKYHSTASSFNRFKTPIKIIDSLSIWESVSPNQKSFLIWGGLGGFACGFAIGLASINDDWKFPKEQKWLVSAGIGALGGLLVGWLLSELPYLEKVNISINDEYDLLRLKDYSKYLYNKNDKIEKNYKSIVE